MKRGDDEVVLTNEELSDVEDENLIDENEFNYLLKVDADLLTNDIHGFKTYDEFKNEWINELNKWIP
ncbi:hypothetical protein Tco_1326228 [Tanacetum coccineum]